MRQLLLQEKNHELIIGFVDILGLNNNKYQSNASVGEVNYKVEFLLSMKYIFHL